MEWYGFIASIVIALIVGSISKVFRDARGGNFFAALIGAQLGVLLVSSLEPTKWIRPSKLIIGILCSILVTWLLSLGKKEDREEPSDPPSAPPEQK